jgi:anti-sigma regulatory factor (Ser/Thr protein kinase)
MQDEDRFFLEIAAEPASLALVREAVATRAAQLGMGERAIADLKTVVSEACANAVVHAYAGEEAGILEVEMSPVGHDLSVVVRDRGGGIHPRPDAGKPASLRLGLLLIGALSCSFQLSSARGRGTELKMRMPRVATA